jgi:hypothetical protein
MVVLGGGRFLMSKVPLYAVFAKRWSMRVSFLLNLEGGVTKSAPHLALTVIAWDKLTFDERVVLTRMGVRYRERPNSSKYAPPPLVHYTPPARHASLPHKDLKGLQGYFARGYFL